MAEKIVYISAMEWSRLGNMTAPILQNDERSEITDNGDGCVRVRQAGQKVDLLIPNTLIVRAVERPAPPPVEAPEAEPEETETKLERPKRREPAIPPPPRLA